MNTHLKNKEIEKLVAGIASVKDGKKAGEHLAVCSQCKTIFDTLTSIVGAQPLSAIPGEHVKDNIIAGWHSINSMPEVKHRAEKSRLKKYIGGLAVAVSVLVAVSSYMLITRVQFEDKYNLTVTSVSGEMLVNGTESDIKPEILSGDIIRTGTHSSAQVSSDDYILYIGESTTLTIAADNFKTGIKFLLNQGYVVSKSSGRLLYSFKTGDYEITPAGTEFLLRYNDGVLTAAISQGRLMISGAGLTIEISAGEKWSSENPGEIEPIDDKTADFIKYGPPDNGSSLPGDLNRINGKRKNISEKSVNIKPENKNDTSTEDTESSDIKKERLEMKKSSRVIRDEMKDIKKEQRKERNRKNRK